MTFSSPHLICASKDTITIFDPSTTSIVHKITLPSQTQIIVQDLKLDNGFLWLVYKGSTIIQLWNVEASSQIFSQNIARFQGRQIVNGTITVLHPIVGQNQLWIATDTGDMFIFDVKCAMSRERLSHDSDIQLKNNNSSWECHQSVVDKVVDYLSSMSNDSPRNNMESQENDNQSQRHSSRNEKYAKRLSVTMIENDFVDISILAERSQKMLSKSKERECYETDYENSYILNQYNSDDVFNCNPNMISNSDEKINLRQKTFLSLKGGMKISDSPIQHICSLIFPNDIGEAFISMSSYMEEENNMVIWKQETQGWKYKVMHYQSLEKSKSFFSRLLQKINLPLV